MNYSHASNRVIEILYPTRHIGNGPFLHCRTGNAKYLLILRMIMLGAWVIWKHRNACVFEGASPSVNSILRELNDEHSLWCFAGAKKLQNLGLVSR